MADTGAGESPQAPLTERGARTRERLIAAAREVFEERGFLDTRVAHIARHAKVAYGSFYTYFPSKEAVFLEVADRLFEDMTRHSFTPGADPAPGTDSTEPAARVRRANRAYYEAYRRNAKMMAIIEQVSTRVASWTAKVGSKLTGLLRSCKTLTGLLDDLKSLMREAGTLFDSVLKGAKELPHNAQEAVAGLPGIRRPRLIDLAGSLTPADSATEGRPCRSARCSSTSWTSMPRSTSTPASSILRCSLAGSRRPCSMRSPRRSDWSRWHQGAAASSPTTCRPDSDTSDSRWRTSTPRPSRTPG